MSKAQHRPGFISDKTQLDNSVPFVCKNCDTDSTPLWRKVFEANNRGWMRLCNRCGVYFTRHKVHRSLDSDDKKRPSTNNQESAFSLGEHCSQSPKAGPSFSSPRPAPSHSSPGFPVSSPTMEQEDQKYSARRLHLDYSAKYEKEQQADLQDFDSAAEPSSASSPSVFAPIAKPNIRLTIKTSSPTPGEDRDYEQHSSASTPIPTPRKRKQSIPEDVSPLVSPYFPASLVSASLNNDGASSSSSVGATPILSPMASASAAPKKRVKKEQGSPVNSASAATTPKAKRAKKEAPFHPTIATMFHHPAAGISLRQFAGDHEMDSVLAARRDSLVGEISAFASLNLQTPSHQASSERPAIFQHAYHQQQQQQHQPGSMIEFSAEQQQQPMPWTFPSAPSPSSAAGPFMFYPLAGSNPAFPPPALALPPSSLAHSGEGKLKVKVTHAKKDKVSKKQASTGEKKKPSAPRKISAKKLLQLELQQQQHQQQQMFHSYYHSQQQQQQQYQYHAEQEEEEEISDSECEIAYPSPLPTPSSTPSAAASSQPRIPPFASLAALAQQQQMHAQLQAQHQPQAQQQQVEYDFARRESFVSVSTVASASSPSSFSDCFSVESDDESLFLPYDESCDEAFSLPSASGNCHWESIPEHDLEHLFMDSQPLHQNDIFYHQAAPYTNFLNFFQ